jgi:hypothetical protein
VTRIAIGVDDEQNILANLSDGLHPDFAIVSNDHVRGKTPLRVLICYDREEDDMLPAIRNHRAALGALFQAANWGTEILCRFAATLAARLGTARIRATKTFFAAGRSHADTSVLLKRIRSVLFLDTFGGFRGSGICYSAEHPAGGRGLSRRRCLRPTFCGA